jgi:beta-N-acetylhexosaminidase
MKKRYIFVIIILIVLVLVFALLYMYNSTIEVPQDDEQSTLNQTNNTSQNLDQTQNQAATPIEIVDPIKDQIKNMTPDEKIGQMVIVGIDGYENNDNSKQLIEKYKVGGFIFFSRNIENPTQFLTLVNSLKTVNMMNKTPLFFSIDEEGGRVSRMPKEILNLPTSKSIGKIDNPDFSYKIGGLIGEELKLFGLNMDFAPVLDINSNPQNPVIGERAFGSKADTVSKLGVQTMKGVQSKNIISVVKHFPGHGDTAVDSHIGLPTVENDLRRLESFELLPFAQAINNDADAVMVAHIMLPKIDPENPSSFSKKIITDILRTNLNFDGVVITDDMTMGAISNNYDIGEAAVKSINAGTDIVLVCHYYDKEVAVINAIKNALDDGTISEDRIDQSVYRVLALKNKYALSDGIIKTINVKSINDKIRETLKLYIKD